MNWIGGSRARAKVRQQLNARDTSQNKRRRLLSLLEDADADNGDHMSEDDELGPSRNEPNVENEASFTETGLRLIAHNQVQRRVVPLLEFIEKKLPGGHLLSLQLNHQMDITRTPPATLHDRDEQRSTPVSGPPVPASSRTITTPLNNPRMPPPIRRCPPTTASTVSSQNMPPLVDTKPVFRHRSISPAQQSPVSAPRLPMVGAFPTPLPYLFNSFVNSTPTSTAGDNFIRMYDPNNPTEQPQS